MKLDKADALLLVKLINMAAASSRVELSDDSLELEGRLSDFVLGNDEDEYAEEQEDDSEDEADSDEEDSEESEEEEDEEQCEDEECDACADEDDEDDDGGDLEADVYVEVGELHDLKPVKATVVSSSVADVDTDVSLEFEALDDESCSLLVGGYPLDNVTLIKRFAKELHVAVGEGEERAWHRFSVKKFPKGWVTTLVASQLVGVR